jgi:hypothetical protein
MKQKVKYVYVTPQCVAIETCAEQLLVNTSITGNVNNNKPGGSFAKENSWDFEDTFDEEETSNEIYFNENY